MTVIMYSKYMDNILSCYHNELKLHNVTVWPDMTSHDPHDLTDWSSNISTGTDIRPHSSLQWQPCVRLDDTTLASVSPEAESGSSWGNIPLPWHWHMHDPADMCSMWTYDQISHGNTDDMFVMLPPWQLSWSARGRMTLFRCHQYHHVNMLII